MPSLPISIPFPTHLQPLTNPQLQALAAAFHHKSPSQLLEIRAAVGPERIMVLHGTHDNMITVPHGRKLISMLRPAVGVIREGMGHVAMIEEVGWHDGMVEGMVERVGRLGKSEVGELDGSTNE